MFLISTPIGNLEDISLRAVRLLKEADLILAEDTRHAKILLSHYQIDTPVKSYHQFNEAKQEKEILEKIQSGLKIALITDAGTPGIADPGERIVKACVEKGLSVTPIGGPSAFLLALIASGLSTERFQFLGFLPRKKGEMTSLLEEIKLYPGTSITYESPKRIEKTLQLIEQHLPNTTLVIARELTKKFEEFLRGCPKELIEHFKSHPPKGEMVLLFDKTEQEFDLNDLPTIIEQYIEEGHTKKEAIDLIAKRYNLPKKVVYKAAL